MSQVAISALLTRTGCRFAELTSRGGRRCEWTETMRLVIFYARPPVLLSFTNPLMKLSSTVWTLTPSHFPALRHHSIPPHQPVFCWAHEICRSFFWGFGGTDCSDCTHCPLCSSHTLTLTFLAKCGGGEAPPSGDLYLWVSVLVWMHVRGCVSCTST